MPIGKEREMLPPNIDLPSALFSNTAHKVDSDDVIDNTVRGILYYLWT